MPGKAALSTAYLSAFLLDSNITLTVLHLQLVEGGGWGRAVRRQLNTSPLRYGIN